MCHIQKNEREKIRVWVGWAAGFLQDSWAREELFEINDVGSTKHSPTGPDLRLRILVVRLRKEEKTNQGSTRPLNLQKESASRQVQLPKLVTQSTPEHLATH